MTKQEEARDEEARDEEARDEEARDEEAREQHRSDWIKAEYETMGWNKEQEIVDVAIKPLIEEE